MKKICIMFLILFCSLLLCDKVKARYTCKHWKTNNDVNIDDCVNNNLNYEYKSAIKYISSYYCPSGTGESGSLCTLGATPVWGKDPVYGNVVTGCSNGTLADNNTTCYYNTGSCWPGMGLYSSTICRATNKDEMT